MNAMGGVRACHSACAAASGWVSAGAWPARATRAAAQTIQQAPDGREVKQFKRSGGQGEHGGDHHLPAVRPACGGGPPQPHGGVQQACGNGGCASSGDGAVSGRMQQQRRAPGARTAHVVAVVKVHQRQVPHVRRERAAQQHAQQHPRQRCVQAKDAQGGEIQGRHDQRCGAKIIQALCPLASGAR